MSMGRVVESQGQADHSAETLRFGAWAIEVRAEKGPVRQRMEDAWCVAGKVEHDGRSWLVAGVFDGLGGMPNGDAAALAAAQALPDAFSSARKVDTVLPALNDAVMLTGGTTTAAALALDMEHGEGWIVSAGDSSLYGAADAAAADDAPHITRLNAHDNVSRHVLSDYLGHREMAGHIGPVKVAKSGVLLLCTDGVDEVAGIEAITEIVQAGAENPRATMDRLFERVAAAGAPDNGTAILIHRYG